MQQEEKFIIDVAAVLDTLLKLLNLQNLKINKSYYCKITPAAKK